MGEWISVEDMLPEKGSLVMTYHVDGYHEIEGITEYDLAVLRGEEYSQTCGQFAHWMPLPPPPKGE